MPTQIRKVTGRWIVLAALASLLVGFGVGVSFGARPVVIVHDRDLPSLAPEMSAARFLTCTEVAAEPDLDALFVRWALRYWQPDWPAP
jgi:hypothetical protein